MVRSKTKLNVLGTDYTVEILPVHDDAELALGLCSGYCDRFSKRIVISDYRSYAEYTDADFKHFREIELSIARHEIIHAFIYESGLSTCTHVPPNWAENEEMVDWFSLQWSKISKAIDKVYMELIEPVTDDKPR